MFDIGTLVKGWYRGKGVSRHETANPYQEVFNPFDIPSSLIQDMISRGIRPWTVQTVSLAAAGEITIMSPGFHAVIYGHDGTPNKAVNTTAYAECWWGEFKPGVQGFPMKHARGLSGPFQQLHLRWPAQGGVYMDVITFAGMFQPWIDGESCT